MRPRCGLFAVSRGRDYKKRTGLPFLFATIAVFIIAIIPVQAAPEDPGALSGPHSILKPAHSVPMASGGDDLDTVWYDFSGGSQGWSFLNDANVVQVYYPDASCEQQWRIDTTSYYSSLSPATFLGETSLRYYVNFHGYYSNSCSYNWWIKSCISPDSDNWNEVFKIQARIYIESPNLQYVMIGVKMEGDDGFTYYGWGSPLSSETWHTISLTEPSSGAFADLEAVSIIAGGYSAQSNLYIDYVRGIKNVSSAPNLVSPSNGATTEDNLPAFSWSGDGDHYSLQIATDAAFQDIVVDSTDINGSNCTVTTPLPFSDYTYTPAGGPHDPNYYWRVRAHYTSAGVSPWSSARTVVVNGPHEVPTEFPTIRAARNALPTYIGGTVIVHPGTYTGLDNCQIGLGGEKPVDIVSSSSDPSQTIIDGQNTYYGFTTDLYTVGSPLIEGFTFRNMATGEGNPGAISLWTGWATIKNCTIENSNGLGIYGRSGAHATVANSTIRNCANGGVKMSLGSWVTMTGTTIENNPQFGVELNSNASSYIENCDFNSNSGTGLNVLNGSATVNGCTFYGNTSLTYAGGMFVSTWDSVIVEHCQFDYNTGEEAGAIVVYEGNDIFINNSTFAYNSSGISILTDKEYAAVVIDQCIFANSTQGAGIEWYDTSYDIDITCTDAYGNAGGNWIGLAANSLGQSGNIQADPQFCGPASRNYSLYSTSPCLAVNNTCGQLMGLYGQGCTQSLACSAYAISEDSGAAPWTVSFQSNASGGTPPYGYTWDFGDGDTSFVANPTHTFQSEGTYTVMCEISDESDQTCTRTIPIVVTAPLTCSLAVTDTAGPAPHGVTLTGFAFGGEPPYYYEWNISEIDSSLYGRVVDFEFSTEGTYTTTLRVWDEREFFCESTVDIVVGASLACQMSATPDSGSAPLEVAFEAVITGGEEPYTYLWDFGDNTTSSEANPTHIYDTDGVYTVLLNVGDATEKECVSETQVVITPALSCMATAEPDSGTAPLAVTFGAHVDGGEPPYTYYWDFGDGTFDSTGTDSLTYTYETSGQYQAVFTATDTRDSTCVSVIDLTIDSPVQMAITPDSLDFGLDYDTLELTVDNIGDGTLSWQIMSRPSWLTTMPSSGSFSEGTQIVRVMADRSSLEPDLYTGAISVIGGGDTIVVPVTMEVESGQDVVTVTPTTLPFEYADASLKIQLCNVSGSTVSWFVENSFDWMSMSPSSGTLGPSECRDINVLVSRSNLPTGDYVGRFQVRTDGDQVLNVRTSMSIPLWNLTKGTHGIHVDEPMCVRFNGLIDTETLSEGLSIQGVSQSLNWEHSTDTLHGRTISIVCLSPTQNADFLPLQEIRISGQPSLLDMNGVPFLKPQGPELLFITGTHVWPGDGNADGIVDERDILPIGLYFGSSGPARDVSGMSWEPFKGLAHDATGQWQPYKAIYSDADGSGVIDTADVCAITDNWGAQTVDASPGNPASTAIASAVFGRLTNSTLESLYNAVCNCPESEGRTHLEGLLASQIGHTSDVLPSSPQLYQNYPNPFNPTTTIDFYLPHSGHVMIRVFNLLGQDVKTLYDGFHRQGSGSVTWDASDGSGKTVSSGTYFYVMEYDHNVRLSGRMILLK